MVYKYIQIEKKNNCDLFFPYTITGNAQTWTGVPSEQNHYQIFNIWPPNLGAKCPVTVVYTPEKCILKAVILGWDHVLKQTKEMLWPTKLMEEKHKIQHQPVVRIPKSGWIYSPPLQKKKKKMKSVTNQIWIWLEQPTSKFTEEGWRMNNILQLCHIVSIFESQPGLIHLHQTYFLMKQQLNFGPRLSILHWPEENNKWEQQDVNGGNIFMANSETEVFIFRIRWASTWICILPLCTACYFLMIGESITVYFKYEIYCYIIKYIVTFN